MTLNIKLPKGKTARALEACAEVYDRKVFGGNHAHRLYQLSNACLVSTGDVYVSAPLWEEIKEYYDR